MILKASQRSGGRQLAAHLLNTRDNEHVEVHELRGFASGELPSAFQEAEAVSRGTRAKQFLFSLSLKACQYFRRFSRGLKLFPRGRVMPLLACWRSKSSTGSHFGAG